MTVPVNALHQKAAGTRPPIPSPAVGLGAVIDTDNDDDIPTGLPDSAHSLIAQEISSAASQAHPAHNFPGVE